MSLIVDTTFKGISVESAKVTIGDIYIADGHAVLSITANWLSFLSVSKTSNGKQAVRVEIRETQRQTVDICRMRSSVIWESPSTPLADTGPVCDPCSGVTSRPPTNQDATLAHKPLLVRRSMLYFVSSITCSTVVRRSRQYHHHQ